MKDAALPVCEFCPAFPFARYTFIAALADILPRDLTCSRNPGYLATYFIFVISSCLSVLALIAGTHLNLTIYFYFRKALNVLDIMSSLRTRTIMMMNCHAEVARLVMWNVVYF